MTTAWISGIVYEWQREVWGEIHSGEACPEPIKTRRHGHIGQSFLIPVTEKLARYCEQEAELYSGPGVVPECRYRARPHRIAAQRIRAAIAKAEGGGACKV